MHRFAYSNASRAASLALCGGSLCLDFANTASGRAGPHFLEHLQQPQHLAEWAGHAGLFSKVQTIRFKRCLAEKPGAGRQLLQRAIELREAIHAIGSAWSGRTAAPRWAISVLSKSYAASLRRAMLDENERALRWTWHPNASHGPYLIGCVGQSALELMGEDRRGRIKQCAGEDCGWLFLDSSRNNSRRWCDMQVCGNRAKMRRFRERAGKDQR